MNAPPTSPAAEEKLTRLVKTHLDQALAVEHFEQNTLNRLKLAREEALAQHAQRTLGGQPGNAFNVFNISLSGTRRFATVASLVFTIGIVGFNLDYWSHDKSTMHGGTDSAMLEEELDTALVADELPIRAYLDHGFQLWLEQQ